MRPLNGIHHISAITGDAARNVAFYTGTMGLRLVAKSVNQDDPTVYHLFFADEEAHPGSDLTFFEYPGATPGRPGAGMVHRIVWRVASDAALDFWEQRLTSHDVEVARAPGSARFADPEGLAHELVINTTADEPLIALHPEVPAEFALQGFEGVRAYSRDPQASAEVLTGIMGAKELPSGAFELRGEARGGWVAFDPAPQLPGNQSAGVVHHVAFTVGDDQAEWVDELARCGFPSSGLVDRTYFMALYFREPGGVLYELSTAEPGFTVDGPVQELGTRVILPPWLEPHRAAIEANLTPLPDPRASWREAAATRG
ncbi:MAG: ring-cleaving dioxygenase [Thermoleophilia bacterium]|nr:ring-cleaving dioxygenase [Thermoleophilia bacterium]